MPTLREIQSSLEDVHVTWPGTGTGTGSGSGSGSGICTSRTSGTSGTSGTSSIVLDGAGTGTWYLALGTVSSPVWHKDQCRAMTGSYVSMSHVTCPYPCPYLCLCSCPVHLRVRVYMCMCLYVYLFMCLCVYMVYVFTCVCVYVGDDFRQMALRQCTESMRNTVRYRSIV